MLSFLLARAKEPSSYAGLGALLGTIGVSLAPNEWQATVAVFTSVVGLAAIFVPEQSATSPSTNNP